MSKSLFRTWIFCALGALCGLFASFNAWADLDTRLESWNLFFVTAPISGQWDVYAEAQPRLTLSGTANHRLLIRPAVRYRITPALSGWLGYAWTPTFEPGFRNENRIWQQLQYEVPFRGWTFNLRSRLEERWIADTREAGQPAYRLRQWFRALISTPIDLLCLALTDEAFFNLNTIDGGTRSGFDQNRLFIGGNWRVSEMLSIEGGYLNNLVNLPSNDRMNHVLYTFVMWNIR